MRRLPLPLLVSLTLLASPGAFAARDRVAVTVVPVGGSSLAREVATQLESTGNYYVELAPSGAGSAVAVPAEQARACLAEGRALQFRMEYGSAIAALESCLERVGPGLSRPEGSGALSALLVELGAAAVGAGERERARYAFARLARLPDPTPPDPSVQPPAVMQAWEEAKRGGEPSRPVLVEAIPPWTTVWIDGRAVQSGERVPLSQGPHFASAEAAGFQTWAGTLLVENDTARLPVRLASLEPEARANAVRQRAGTIPPNAPGAAEEITAAFGSAVLMVAGGRGAAASAVLLLPSDAGKGGGAVVGGRWTPAGGENPAAVIATAASKKLGGGGTRFKPNKKTLVIAGGGAGALLLGVAAASLLQPGDPGTGGKDGKVIWQQPPPPVPPHGRPP